MPPDQPVEVTRATRTVASTPVALPRPQVRKALSRRTSLHWKIPPISWQAANLTGSSALTALDQKQRNDPHMEIS